MLERYIEEVSGYFQKVQSIGPMQEEFLEHFARDTKTSAYDIFLMLQKQRRSMAYKNVNKKIARLFEAGFIEKIDAPSKRGAIYYGLTTAGIYYLAYRRKPLLMRCFRHVVKTYQENVIFKQLLLQYFKPETLTSITDTALISEICLYLQNCCMETESSFKSLSMSTNSTHRYVVTEVFVWEGIPGDENKRLLDFLKNRFTFHWLKDAEIVKPNPKTIEVRNKSESLTIHLKKPKNRAYLIYKDKQLFEFFVDSEIPNFTYIEEKAGDVQEYQYSYLNGRLKSLHCKLVLALAMLVVPGYADFEVLARDTEYVKSLDEIKKDFDSRYYDFLKIREAMANVA